MPKECPQILSRRIAGIAYIVEIPNLLLSFLSHKDRNAACLLAHLCPQGFPYPRGRICLVCRTPMKEQSNLCAERVAMMFCHHAEKVDEPVFVKTQIRKEHPALLGKCVYTRHSASLLS